MKRITLPYTICPKTNDKNLLFIIYSQTSLIPDSVKDIEGMQSTSVVCQATALTPTLPSTICQNITVTNCRNQNLAEKGETYFKNWVGTYHIHFLRPRPIKFNKPTWITTTGKREYNFICIQ